MKNKRFYLFLAWVVTAIHWLWAFFCGAGLLLCAATPYAKLFLALWTAVILATVLSWRIWPFCPLSRLEWRLRDAAGDKTFLPSHGFISQNFKKLTGLPLPGEFVNMIGCILALVAVGTLVCLGVIQLKEMIGLKIF